MMFFFLFLLTFFSQSEEVSCTKKLLEVEQDVAKLFLNYYNEQTKKLDALETFLNSYEKEENNRVKDNEDYLGNPTNSWTLINRFIKTWPNMSPFFHTKQQIKDIDTITSKILHYKEFFLYHHEVKNAIYALLEIQKMYDLDVHTISDALGPFTHSLSPDDMLDIGYYGAHMFQYELAREWLEEALNLILSDYLNYSHRLSQLYEHLAWSCYQSGDIDFAIEYTEKHLQLEPRSHTSINNLAYFKRKLMESIADPNVLPDPKKLDSLSTKQYYSLCGNDRIMPKFIRKTLYCEYITPHEMFYIKPMKMETINHDPKIVIFHDLLHDYEIRHITNVTQRNIDFTQEHTIEIWDQLPTIYHPMSAWIDHDQDSIAMNILKRIGALTKLDMDYAEQLQIINNGIGGYVSHNDFASPNSNSIFGYYGQFGNRIASLSIFLTDVERGGNIIFPKAGKGVVASPTKGSAVFWYNLMRNGTGDFRTIHADCPVINSEKWLAKLWVHEHGQEFIRPCLFNQNE